MNGASYDSTTDDDDNTIIQIRAIGSGKAVWNGLTRKTSSGLTRADLVENKRGKTILKKMSDAAKLRYPAMRDKMCETAGFKKPNVAATPGRVPMATPVRANRNTPVA